jgi:hypothetical protein
MRSPLGLKIAGPNLQRIQEIGVRVEELLRDVRGTRSVFAERTNDGRYIDIQWDRGELARAGIAMEEAQTSVQNAIGGDNVTTVIQGRARFPVNVRLPRDSRGNLDALRRVLVGGSGGDPVPLGQLATVRIVPGPAMVRDENAMLTGYVYLDLDGRDPDDYVADAAGVLARKLSLASGYTLSWSGQYEAFQRISLRLVKVVPLTLVFIAVLLYWNMRSAVKTGLVLLAVPFSAIGAIWSLYLHGALSGLGLAKVRSGGPDGHACGFAPSRDRRGSAPYPAQVHDGRHDVLGPRTDPLVHRCRRGSDETDCGADRGWSRDLVPDGTDRLSDALRAVEIPHSAERVGAPILMAPTPRGLRPARSAP